MLIKQAFWRGPKMRRKATDATLNYATTTNKAALECQIFGLEHKNIKFYSILIESITRGLGD